MSYWCARCQTLVPMVRQERRGTSDLGGGIVRGVCATCGASIGEIGVYSAPAAEDRLEHDREAYLVANKRTA